MAASAAVARTNRAAPVQLRGRGVLWALENFLICHQDVLESAGLALCAEVKAARIFEQRQMAGHSGSSPPPAAGQVDSTPAASSDSNFLIHTMDDQVAWRRAPPWTRSRSRGRTWSWRRTGRPCRLLAPTPKRRMVVSTASMFWGDGMALEAVLARQLRSA